MIKWVVCSTARIISNAVFLPGPDKLGDSSHEVFVYYENTEEKLYSKSKHPYRIHHLSVQTKVLPSISVGKLDEKNNEHRR